MAFVPLIGAPGAGASTIARAVVDDEPDVQVASFDLIGVPSEDEMVRDHGSPDEWRRWATGEWMRRLAPAVERGESVILEGTMQVAHVEDAARSVGVRVTVVIVDCEDDVRAARLAEDGRSDLEHDANALAERLRDDAAERGTRVIDTSMRGVASCADEVIRLVRR